MPEIVEDAKVAEVPRGSQVHWDAVFGGFVLVVSMSWLLFCWVPHSVRRFSM